MLQLEEAVERILRAVPPAQRETVPLRDCVGRFVAEQIASPIDLPPFTNSSMDGYAVVAKDTRPHTPDEHPTLKIVGRIPAGQSFSGTIQRGECVRLFTGSPLPAGADAVVMQEDTRPSPRGTDFIEIIEGVQPGESVRHQAEDVRRGSGLFEVGEQLGPAGIALLSAVGLGETVVGKCPTVGILATGSELRESGQPLGPGEIYESNRAGLAALLVKARAPTRVFPLVRDDLEATKNAVAHALSSCDMLITSGGVSVGEMDFVKAAVGQNGGELSFWKVAIKPGRPFVFGQCQGKLIFGLPGNPVSALVTFLLLVRPAVLRWQGAREIRLPVSFGTAAEDLVNNGKRRHFVRVQYDPNGMVRCSGLQASHVLSSLARANGLVDLAPENSISAGTLVPVLRWD